MAKIVHLNHDRSEFPDCCGVEVVHNMTAVTEKDKKDDVARAKQLAKQYGHIHPESYEHYLELEEDVINLSLRTANVAVTNSKQKEEARRLIAAGFKKKVSWKSYTGSKLTLWFKLPKKKIKKKK